EHVDIGIADEPDVVPGQRAGTFAAEAQGMVDMVAVRLVAGAVAGPGEALEVGPPPEPLGFEAQEVSALVADHAEIDAGITELAQELGGTRQRRQRLEMHPAEGIVEDLLRILPAGAE